MTLFGGMISITSVSFLMFSLCCVAVLGYALGRIKIKGINLGTAGVFVTALLYGSLFYGRLASQLSVSDATYVSGALKIIENLGLILFVSSVGFISGGTFVDNFKRNFKSYVLLGFVIILAGALTTAACILLGRGSATVTNEEFTAILAGIMAGALTSTPALSAAKTTVLGEHLESCVTVGYGIAYLFGVIGVVMFVQIVPKLLKADMRKEREALKVGAAAAKGQGDKLLEIDPLGMFPFMAAALLGIFVGAIKFGSFSLTTTGGCLLVSLLFAHYGRVGRVSLTPLVVMLKVFREFGLMLFLMGAGVSAGSSFVKYFQPVYFLYGMIITLVPMIVGFIIARKLMRLGLLNALGSITGGMTSTPALGTLIYISKTEDVATAYAATYPVALVSVVISVQLILQFF